VLAFSQYLHLRAAPHQPTLDAILRLLWLVLILALTLLVFLTSQRWVYYSGEKNDTA